MKNTRWTTELKHELLDFFNEENKNANNSVSESAEKFAKAHHGMTPSQVKSAYYKFSHDINATPKSNLWTEKENKALLEAVEKRNGSRANVFRNFGEKYNRNYNNVSQHYYFLMRTQEETNHNATKNKNAHKSNANKNELGVLINDVKKMPKKTYDSIYHIISTLCQNIQ